MASLDLTNTVQPPTLTRTPTPLDLLPKVQQGGLFCNGRLSWSLCNGAVYVSNMSTGDCLQNWSPSSPGEEVTMVSELRGPKGSLLVVAIEGYGCHMIGVLSPNWGKLIRGVSIPDKITSLHSFNFDGFSEKCIETYRCPDIFPSSVLSLFNGIVAIGTVGGRSYLVDLQLGLGASSGDCLNDPSPLHIIEGPVTERDITSMSESGHVTVEISKGRFQRGKFMYLQSLLSTSSVVVTAMYFAPQISALFVGYSFGGFQMYDLSTFQLLHTCAVSAPLSPVTHLTYVEPENDPRKFVYVWVMRGYSRFVEGSCGATAYLYQMIFSEKVNGPGDHTHYHGFQGCGLRFEHILNDNPHSSMWPVVSRVLTCATPIRHRQEQPGHSLELDLSQAVLVWMVPPQTSTSDSECTWSVFVGLFDVNQWYHSQMPRCIRWKAKGKYDGVFGCSYLSFYNVSSALPTSPDTTVMDALVECLMPFYSNPPMPETFMWPSAAKFNLKILTNSSLATCQCLGIQRMVLRQLDECRGSLFAQPEVLFQLCAHTELLPSSCDHTPSRNLSSQRAALLGVVISHGAPTRILTSFADSWAGAGGDDPVISQWVESTRAELEQTKKLIYAKCFCEDPSPTPLSGHRRRVAAIEVFLGRLLSRGFQREGQRTGALYQAVGQLRLTVAGHKKVMEVICFLNEEGLACDYPSAALKRRYDTLRGGAELGNKLAIDCLIEDHHGNGDDSAPLYPPLSLLNYMEFLMTFDPLIQHCLVLYLLADLGSLTTPPCSPQCRYAASNELPSDLLNTIHSLWLVDNVKFKDPAYQREINVLFKRTSPHSLFPWQHGVILERLMQYGEVERALSYLQIHGQTLQELEELKLKIGVYVGNSLVKPAYHLLTQFEGSENYEELFKFFLECCIEGKCLHLILDLPLSSLAETTAVLYLEQHTLLICRELLVLYFAAHHRFVEALAMQESIRPFAKSDPDPNAMVRCAQRDALLAGLASVVPSSLHHVKLTHDDLRGQSSKVKVQVNKSLSSVVAKAVKCEGVTGGGGAVYSLIQTLAEKRLAPSDPMTPLRPSRMSVTMLSQTPFLSTPVSVKKLRASLSRPHRVLTPTPRSRPPTPHQSHTHQRFVSHIQSFKDRMAALLNHSSTGDLDLSDLQTPSPMKAGQLLRPVITPTSILKGSRSASKLTDKRIRFAVEGSPSPEKERQRQVYTPFVPSSLSTTTSIAITTPLPSSDDDCYESPVESPSQLHSPTPAHSPPHLSTKLDYRDAENSPAKETATVTMETDDSSPSEDDDDEMDGNIEEKDVSIVGQEASDEESEDLELSEPVRHIPAPTNTSPYQDMDLTRGKLVSSVSPKHDPKTKATKQSLPSQVPTFRSMRGGPSSSVSLKHEGSVGSTNTFSSPFIKHPQTPAASTTRLFAPVTKEMTPVTQLFSPVPYLSDLIQAKKDKLHSSFQQLKQRDMYSIKAPQKTISPMVNQSSFSASMVPNVDVPTGTSYNFSPPTQVPVDAHTTSVTTPERSESMSYVFSPPLTRSAARQRREGSCSVSRESSVEPTLPVGSEAVRRKPRGRPRKVTLPPSDDPVTPPRKVTLPHSDDLVTLVTPPTLPRVLKEPPKKSRPRVKSGMASRRSARLLKK